MVVKAPSAIVVLSVATLIVIAAPIATAFRFAAD